jgi:hypothetical protein
MLKVIFIVLSVWVVYTTYLNISDYLIVSKMEKENN